MLIRPAKCPKCNELIEVDIEKEAEIRKGLIITIVSLLLITAIGFGINKSNKNIYVKYIQTAAEAMFSGAVNAESACNLITSVWYNAFYKKSELLTDQHTKQIGFGSVVYDFNEALGNLFSDSFLAVRF